MTLSIARQAVSKSLIRQVTFTRAPAAAAATNLNVNSFSTLTPDKTRNVFTRKESEVRITIVRI